MALTEVQLQRLDALIGSSVDWNPDLHPRGRDGKFIETGGFVELLGRQGIFDGTRAEVMAIVPNPKSPGNPDVRVQTEDGRIILAKPHHISQVDPTKARIDTPVTLYRGEGSHDQPSYYTPKSGEAGGWWTADIEAARQYAASSKGKLYEIEVDRSEAEPSGSNFFIADPQVRARRRLVEPEFEDYHGQHRPNDEGPRAFDLTEVEATDGLDVYQNPHYYTGYPQKELRETLVQLRKVKGNPDGMVTIYRAAPPGVPINDGDWVTLSHSYAQEHADSQAREGYPLVVQALEVPAASVRWAIDDLMEYGYFPKRKS